MNNIRIKAIFSLAILLIMAVSIYLFAFKSDFYIDIEHSMPESASIDVRVSIDGRELEPQTFKRFAIDSNADADMFSYNGLIGWSGGVGLKLSKGFHRIKIESKKANIKIEDRFFIWKPSQRALIQYINNKLIFQMLNKARIYC